MLNKQIMVYLENDGGIIVDYHSSLLKPLLKACLPFVREATGIKYSRHFVHLEEGLGIIKMPDNYDIDECEIFAKGLITVIKIYIKLSNKQIEVIGWEDI